jgi:hypothetical protein
MTIHIEKIVKRLPAFSWLGAAKIAAYIGGAILAYFLITSAVGGIRNAIFGNPEVKREHANTIVAKEQAKAEVATATQTLEKVHERDVYREHVTNVVHDAQENIDAADHGQQMDPEIDAATAAGLCRVHHSLCRPGTTEDVQPVRQPVPAED